MDASDTEVHRALAEVAAGHAEMLVAEPGESGPASILGERTVALVHLAVSAALDAPPAAYGRQVTAAIDAGVMPPDVLALLRAVAPQIGEARAIAAAPELMLALGMQLPGPAAGGGGL